METENESLHAFHHAKLHERPGDVDRVIDEMRREQAEREARAAIEAAFGLLAERVLEARGRARDVNGDEAPERFAHADPVARAAADEKLAAVSGATLIDPAKLWLVGTRVLVAVTSAFNPANPTAARLIVNVLLADGPDLLAAVAAEERRLRETWIEERVRQAEQERVSVEADARAAREAHERALRDAPYKAMPPTTAAALHIACESTGATRKAWLRFATLSAERYLGAPANADEDVTALATQLAQRFRESAELAANIEKHKQQTATPSSATQVAHLISAR